MMSSSLAAHWSGEFNLSLRQIIFVILLGGATGVHSQEAGDIYLEGVRVGLADNRTRLVFDLSGPVKYRLGQLDDPFRLSIDMADTRQALADMAVPIANTQISSITFSRGEDGVLRALLGFDASVDHHAFLLKPFEARGYRLVLDIHPKPAGLAQAPDGKAGAPTAIAPMQGRAGAAPATAPAPVTGSTAHSRRSRQSPAFQFSGTWEQEAAIETDGGSVQKFEALIEPRLDIELSRDTDITAIGRVRLDAVGDLGPYQHKPRNYSDINGPWYSRRYGEVALRELYLDTRWGGTYWRLGKQQVVWGQADGIKVLDIVNPQSFREYILDDFDDSRIPLYMAKMEAALGERLMLQLLWIPDTTYHELAESDTPYYLTSPQLVPVAPPGLEVSIERIRRPNDFVDDSDVGGRLSGFFAGWDLTLNYLYHYQDFPVLYQQLELDSQGARGVVSPVYERSHMSGGTASTAFGDFTVRAEVAYNSDTFHVATDLAQRGIEQSAELASVLGLDWQLGQYDTLLSAQWFQSHLFDYESDIVRDETEQYFSLFYQKTFAQEVWILDFLALYSLNHQDSLSQMKLKYLWQSNLQIWGGLDVFLGDRDGVFGQFRDQSRVLIGFELGF